VATIGVDCATHCMHIDRDASPDPGPSDVGTYRAQLAAFVGDTKLSRGRPFPAIIVW
jgi:hypothetical protein